MHDPPPSIASVQTRDGCDDKSLRPLNYWSNLGIWVGNIVCQSITNNTLTCTQK